MEWIVSSSNSVCKSLERNLTICNWFAFLLKCFRNPHLYFLSGSSAESLPHCNSAYRKWHPTGMYGRINTVFVAILDIWRWIALLSHFYLSRGGFLLSIQYFVLFPSPNTPGRSESIHNLKDKYQLSYTMINKYVRMSSLTIMNIRAEDYGQYTCTSMNFVGEDKVRFRIQGN